MPRRVPTHRSTGTLKDIASSAVAWFCPLPRVRLSHVSSTLPNRQQATLFLPLIFLGTASGQFLRPAASRLLLSRFLPKGTGSSHKAPARLGSSGLSLLGAPRKWGKKKEKNSCLTSTQ